MEWQGTATELRKRRSQIVGSVLNVALAAVSQVALSSDGELDPAFGAGGIALDQATDYQSCQSSLNAIAAAKDGSVIAVGTTVWGTQPHLAVLKVNPRGNVIATKFFLYANGGGRALVIDPDFGNIYVGADVDGYAGVYKLKSDLTLDMTFDANGLVALEPDSNAQINDMFLFGDLYVVGGSRAPVGGNNPVHIMLDRFDQNGSNSNPTLITRTSFDTVATSIGLYDDYDGIHVMAAGYEDHSCFDFGFRTTYSSGVWNFSTNTYTPGGLFNTVGVDTNNCYIDTMTMLTGDTQLLGGRVVNQDGSWSAYLQVMNSGGYTTDVARVFKMTPWGDNSIRKILVQKDGKWIVVGYSGVDVSRVWGVWVGRFNPDGSADPSFGTDGSTFINFDPQEHAYAQALSATLDTRGRVVVAGTYVTGTSDSDGNDCTEMMMARLQGSELIFADGFDDSGYTNFP
jgi:uncharacterized delta-60 repeat protein